MLRFSWVTPASATPTAGAVLTAPVFGDLEHVGSPGVHFAGFLHPGVAPEMQGESP